MNQEWKFKLHSLYGQLMLDLRLQESFYHVKKNKGSGGVDGETLESYEANLNENILNLISKLKQRVYKPYPVKRVLIPKKDGKKRPLGIPTIEDRTLQQRMVDILQPKFEELLFHSWSTGYRPGRGPKRALQIILWNIEQGYNHIYDCDIKGFFDNIPHSKLIKVLQKYISDRSVLNIIKQWLETGYMEDGKLFRTESGTPQGGVISPLLANVYLSEMDWEWDLHGIRFVRYADDFLLFAKSKRDLLNAIKVTKDKLAELGLEVSQGKTRVVDFNKDDFDFLGFTFRHWEERNRKRVYSVEPKEESLRDFRQKIKSKTCKTLTLNKEIWIERVNPIIRGKVNYYLTIIDAIKENMKLGIPNHCVTRKMRYILMSIDGYIRKRMRVAFIHKHPSQRKEAKMRYKWNIAFFAAIKLIPAYWMYLKKAYDFTLEKYVTEMKTQSKRKYTKSLERTREKGQNYFSSERLKKMQNAWNASS